MAKTPTKRAKPEFSPKKGSRPGAVKRAEKADAVSDRKIARKFGVKFGGHGERKA